MTLISAFAERDWSSRAGAFWLTRQQRRNRSKAAPLAVDVLERLGGFFDRATLESVRMRVVSRLDLPPVFRALRRLRLVPRDTGRLLGITYLDTIVLSDAVANDPRAAFECLVHELVHVVQVRHLGIGEFARRYLAGWTGAGHHYHDIPLERDAREIASRVLAGQPFSVEAEVARRILVGSESSGMANQTR